MRTYIKTGVGFAAAIGIIAAFTYWIGWGDIFFGLSNAQLRYAIPAGALAFIGIILLGVSWWIAVRDVIAMDIIEGVRLFFITFFANSVTPLGQFGGEPFIAYIVSRDADISIEESFGAILAADIINSIPFFTLSLTGILVFLIFHPMSSLVSLILKTVVGIGLAIIVTVFLVATNQERALSFLGTVGHGVNAISTQIGLSTRRPFDGVNRASMRAKGETFFDILHMLLQNKQMLVKASVVAHIQAVLSPIALYLFLLSLNSLHPAVDIPFSALFFILPASFLAGYLPLPGGLGGIEVAMTGLLIAVTEIPAAPASAAVLLFRVCTYGAGLLIGGYLASKMSVDFIAEQYGG